MLSLVLNGISTGSCLIFIGLLYKFLTRDKYYYEPKKSHSRKGTIGYLVGNIDGRVEVSFQSLGVLALSEDVAIKTR